MLNFSLDSACRDRYFKVFCGFLDNLAKSSIFLEFFDTFPFWKLSKRAFCVEFDPWKCFSAPFRRKFAFFFQNSQNEVWQFLRNLKNPIVKPKILKILV